MAGSFEHCRDDDNSFRFDMIENMGDAHEACEEMYNMIWILAMGDAQKVKWAETMYGKTLAAERAIQTGI